MKKKKKVENIFSFLEVVELSNPQITNAHGYIKLWPGRI